VNIVSFETSSARLVFSPPLLSRGGVVPAGPPKWLPPWPPRLMPVPLSPRILLLQSSSQNMFACYIPWSNVFLAGRRRRMCVSSNRSANSIRTPSPKPPTGRKR